MITAKEAVDAARKYMKDIYEDGISGLNVEEIELNDDENIWRVTMGYWEFLPVPPGGQNALIAMTEGRKVRRAYKQLSIQSNTGEVLSMKIRSVPNPEPR